MPNSFEALFRYSCGNITIDVIRAECFLDPGYQDYVKALRRVWQRMALPKEWDFDHREVIGLTLWDDRFDLQLSRFRSFTGSLTLWSAAADKGSSPLDYPIHLTLIRLVQDTLVCMDRRQAALLLQACEEYRWLFPSMIRTEPEDEAWFLLTELLLHSFSETVDSVEQRVVQLLETDELLRIDFSFCNGFHPDVPLLGLCGFDQLHHVWGDLITWCLVC